MSGMFPASAADARQHPDCLCTWAWYSGRMRIKYLNRACPPHGRLA